MAWSLTRSSAPTRYGIACGTSTITTYSSHTNLPHAGSIRFAFGFGRIPAGTSGFMLVAAQPAVVDLNALGMPGCELLLDPQRTGRSFRLPLPSALLGASLYAQFVYVNPGVNALNLEMSQGLRIDIR